MSQYVSSSPHIHTKSTVQTIMRDVIIALVPTLIAAIIIHGWRSLLITAVCIAACMFFEWGFEKICGKPSTISDLSAAVTGILLAYNLPVSIPLWQAVFGSLVAIVAVKQLFGGLGRNFANPAIVARIVLLLAFSGSMTNWAYHMDATASATPLTMLASDTPPSFMSLFLGTHGGCIGETCILTLLIGFIYLLIRGVIQWHTPFSLVATVFVFSWLLGMNPVMQIMGGGLMLCAIFMATDYVTTPSTDWGRVIFGIGAGIITVLVRKYGSYSEGISFAILFMNILTPYINRWTRKKPLGGARA